MRTVTLFGLMCIAEAIATKTKWTPSNQVVTFGALLLILSILFDIIEFVNGF